VSRPEEGKVIEPSVSGDIGEVMLEQAVEELQAEGEIPRVLQVSLADKFDGLNDLAMKHGITWMIRGDFSDGEWCLHNLKEGDERVSYWNKPW
jgi:hypothetical protein